MEKKILRITKPSRGGRGPSPLRSSRWAERLRFKREQLGATQVQVVKLICNTIGYISRRSYQDLENGIVRPRSRVITVLKVFLAKPYRRERRADGSITIREV